MEHEEFMEFCGQQIHRGQRILAASMRRVLAQRAPALYEHIEDADDTVFLEPLLFAHAYRKAPVESLGQLLIGALPRDARPDAIDCMTDAAGRIDVPGIGYFHTERPDATLELAWERLSDRYTLRDRMAVEVLFRLEPRLRLEGCDIDVQRYSHPLLESLIQDPANNVVPVDPEPATRDHTRHLARAFALVRSVDRTYYDQILSCTRRVMLFHERPRVYSFASIAAHGVAFFSTQPGDNEAFFLEDICHQCAHVIFNAVTVCRGEYLKVDPDLPMSQLTGDVDDPRKLYSAFHALYTYYNILRVLQRCERAQLLGTQRAAHEAFGRMAFTGRNCHMDIRLLDRDLYTQLGQIFYERFAEAARTLQLQRADLELPDLSGQTYLFDYATFAARNSAITPKAGEAAQ